MEYQTTIGRVVKTSGIGLHTGTAVNLTLHPAPAYTGLVFRRSDLNFFEIPAQVEFVTKVSYATTLMNKGVIVATVEHILSALWGSGIDNAFIDVDSLEVPIMDGSGECFIDLFEEAGIVELPEPRHFVRLAKKVEVSKGNNSLSIEPDDDFSVDCLIEFDHPLIGQQSRFFHHENGNYAREIASARTFGFAKDVEELRRSGLIRGGGLENAIVLTDEGLMNDGGLRFSDEFVRHKILDIMGDFALFGLPVMGKVRATRSGHALHSQLISKVLRDPSAWEIVQHTPAALVAW
ncbi:MAG TPA: UDP-3-O-acyl-N-acetylglucosamine deacetylase [Blastocatellia bacterium]|nr:UDP-3-O-acyl-N-acetylglucosamine deacetylase [Blastocatellia bacterium]